LGVLPESKRPQKEDIIVNYGVTYIESGVHIPDCGFLSDTSLNSFLPPSNMSDNFLKLFTDVSTKDVDFDIFAASFYILTEYYFYFQTDFDQHGRYNEYDDFLLKNNFFAFPWVNVWANYLLDLIIKKYPHFEKPKNTLSIKLSFDIDHPFAFINKGIAGYAGYFKDLFHADFKNSILRCRTHTGNKDPYDTFDFILKETEYTKSVFFFLGQHLSGYDGKTSFKNKAYKSIIIKVKERGHEIALHPSYLTHHNKQAIKLEKQMLEEISDVEVRSARQHYLRYRLPHTRQYYQQVGIFNDYNSVCINFSGYKNGITCSFPWFDLQENRMSKLIIHPTIIMDVSLKEYMKLTPEQAYREYEKQFNMLRIYGGEVNLLWHNNSLSDIHGWEGWKDVFIAIVNDLKSAI